MNMEGIKDFNERMKKLKEEEGWEHTGDRIEIDDFFPDFEEDINKTIMGLFLDNLTLPRKTDGKLITFAIIITPEGNNIAIRHYGVIENAIKNIKKGDGLRVTYLGKQDKKSGEGYYHNFKVGIKKFEPDTPTENVGETQAPTLADNDDPEAETMIEHYSALIKQEKGNLVDDELDNMIIKYAESDPDLSELEVSRVKAQLALNIKKRKN